MPGQTRLTVADRRGWQAYHAPVFGPSSRLGQDQKYAVVLSSSHTVFAEL